MAVIVSAAVVLVVIALAWVVKMASGGGDPADVVACVTGVMNEEEDMDTPKIAITFDDGPDPYCTEQLLDGLKERGAKASFFVIDRKSVV